MRKNNVSIFVLPPEKKKKAIFFDVQNSIKKEAFKKLMNVYLNKNFLHKICCPAQAISKYVLTSIKCMRMVEIRRDL